MARCKPLVKVARRAGGPSRCASFAARPRPLADRTGRGGTSLRQIWVISFTFSTKNVEYVGKHSHTTDTQHSTQLAGRSFFFELNTSMLIETSEGTHNMTPNTRSHAPSRTPHPAPAAPPAPAPPRWEGYEGMGQRRRSPTRMREGKVVRHAARRLSLSGTAPPL